MGGAFCQEFAQLANTILDFLVSQLPIVKAIAK
jgi:hypothetical protein